ncbi:MAG: hypothetical protein ABIF10_02130 [Candidatus Woesearchaeota archaeon]
MTEDDLEKRIRQQIDIPKQTPSSVKSSNPLYNFVDFLSHNKYRCGVNILLACVGYELYKELQGDINPMGAILHSLVSFSTKPLDRLYDMDYFGYDKNKHPSYVVVTTLTEMIRVVGLSVIPIVLFGGLKQAIDYFRFRKSSSQAEKMMLDKKRKQSLITYTETSAINKLRSYKQTLQASFHGTRDLQGALEHTKKALELDPENFLAIADHALERTGLYAEKEQDWQEMLTACYKFWKRISTGDYHNPLKWSGEGYRAVVGWRETLDKRRGKDNLASQEKLGHNLGIGVASTLLMDYEVALESLDLAMNFESMLKKADIDASKFVIEKSEEGKKTYIFDKEAFEQHLIELDVSDKQLALVCATAYDSVAKESKIFRSKAHERSQWAWGKVFEKTKGDRRSRMQTLGESKSLTYVFSEAGFIEDEVVFKENKDRRTLEDEVVTTFEIAEIVQKNDNLIVPYPIGIYEYTLDKEPTYVYIMRRSPGRTFKHYIDSLVAKELSTDDFTFLLNQIVDYMALLHHRIKAQKYVGREPELRVRQHLQMLKLEEQYINKVILSCKPVFENYNSSKKEFHKDAHAGNWQIDSSSICSLDNEKTAPAPCQSDMVKLLELYPGITESIKEKAVERYCRFRIKRQKPLLLKYYNEIIHLTLRNAGSLISWDSNVSIREHLFAQSKKSIERIAKDFPQYYGQFEREYAQLPECLDTIQDHCRIFRSTRLEEAP